MSISNRLQRAAGLCGLVCIAVLAVTAGTAVAASERQLHAIEESYSTYGTADTSPALAQERYLESYGDPQPLSPPESTLPADGTPWLVIALSVTGGLVIAAASATQLRRLRLRRRRAAGSAA